MKRLNTIMILLWLTTLSAEAQSLAFDPAGQLTESRLSATQRVSYAYDSWGNITQSVVAGVQGETDSEGDGMPDAWELVYFNTTTNGAAGDPNLNGKNNLWEFQNGYDPLDPDSDGDGAPNTDEIGAGTDPLDANSVFILSGFRPAAPGTAGPVVEWSSITNKNYRLQRSTNLLSGFMNLRTNIPATPPLNVQTDATGVGLGPRLYRVEQE